MITDRSNTTQFLSRLLEQKCSGPGKHLAKEVTLDYGTINPKRVDYMEFTPSNVVNVSGIEKGIFTCYEIKSCKEDVYSGNGINFFGEKNYLVMTMQTWKDIQEDFRNQKLDEYIRTNFPHSSHYYGIMVAVPLGTSPEDEYVNPTPLNDREHWELKVIIPCRQGLRDRSMTELLFCMLRSVC